MTSLLSFSMLLALMWPIVAQDSLRPSQAPALGTEPLKPTQQAVLSTHAIGLTHVPFKHSTRRQTESQTMKGTASPESVDKDSLFVGTQSLQQNGGPIGGADTDVSHTKTTLASSSAGPLSTGARGGLPSSLHPATEPWTPGSSSLREEAVGLTESSQSAVHSTTQVSAKLEPVVTEGPIQSPTEGASPPAGSGDQDIPVSKTTPDGSPVTVTISPLPPRKLTSTSTTLTKMAEAQPRPTASIILRPVPTPGRPAKTSPPPTDSQSDWESSTAAVTTTAVSTAGFQPAADTGLRNSTHRTQSAGSTNAPVGATPALTSTATPQLPSSSPTGQRADSTTLKDTFTATTSHLAKEAVPRGPTVNRTHIIRLTFPNLTLTTGNGKRTRTGVISPSSLIPTTPGPGAVGRDGKKRSGSSSMALIPPPVWRPSPSTSSSVAPCVEGTKGCVVPKSREVMDEPLGPNGTSLDWADLSRTLSFAWELHVFGSAALFLLLAAGGALGLALSPAASCPSRGALVLSNGFLLLVGALRGAHFLLDPYGSRRLLPQAGVAALVTLPLPLLLWAQAALAALVVRGAGLELELVPPTLLRPPLLAVLAVLQCTLLLAGDLLSPALSPAVPMVLQSLTLLAGLVLCLGFLCLVLPRLACAQQEEQHRGKAGGRWLWRALGRVLAVCSLLGALCCLLHIHACLWIYGMLGDWRHFSWAWWLNMFWARMLELAWAFCLLLIASWLFWRPRGGARGSTAGAAGGAGANGGAGEISSPCQTAAISHPHTCWAKIVQSLKGRPGRKSESAGAGANGAGGSGGGAVAGELPNNWAGQERSGADISKSLIRNREPKDSNRSRQQGSGGGSLLRLQALTRTPARSLSSSLDRDKESSVSLCDFDLRPPSPIDLSRSIDEALHREHLLHGGSLFRPLRPPSPSPSPEPPSPGPWLRRNSDPQLTLSDSSGTVLTESSEALDRVVDSAVPSRQVTAPPTPTHQGPRWVVEQQVPSSLSCPVSLRPSCNSLDRLTPAGEDTRPFLTPDLDRTGSELDSSAGKQFLKVSRQDDSASVSSDIIDL
ncbi:hypothetical protein AALO_G00078210 [Alosa alosa]|uniref:Proline-rich transmembrane protein 3/4 domain-containing protein n=1 Tax=Alosa alosa TaxID=278164 RepID=A0AAV6H0J1_9TELE|nr:proline-rich transmembrane protein 3 [Alosa alosa]KAG5279477.1 hypothetical protein AALO_G00078210 [Alosa alosa]